MSVGVAFFVVEANEVEVLKAQISKLSTENMVRFDHNLNFQFYVTVNFTASRMSILSILFLV